MATQKEKSRRIVAFIFGLAECLVFAGGIYGWAAIVFVLKEDGVFSHLCEESNADNATESNGSNPTENLLNSTDLNSTKSAYPTCPEQDERLNLAFTVANFVMQGSTLAVGYLFDKYGLRTCRIICLILYVAGSLMMGFASAEVPGLVFPGLMCFGIGGIMILVTNLQIGNFFDRFQLTAVTIYNSAFDTSSVTLLIIKILAAKGIRRLYCFIFIAIASGVILCISTFVLLPKFKIIPRRQIREDRKKAIKYEVGEEGLKEQVPFKKEKSGSDEDIAQKNSADTPLEKNGNLPVIEERRFVKPLRHYVLTRFYLIHLMWHALIQLRFFMYIGSLNVWLQIVTNDDVGQVSFLTNIFSSILMCGILAGPLEGFILECENRRLKKEAMTYFDSIRPAAIPQMLCTSFCLILSILVLFPVVELLYVQFILLTLFRAFLYGLNCAFIVMAFPPDHFGKLFGILMTFNALIGALQYPLFIWSTGPPRNPTPVNVLLLVLTVITYLQPLQLWLGDKFSCLRKVPAENVQPPKSIEA